MMNQTFVSLLLVLLVAVATAFAPVAAPARADTRLNINNQYTRGGKASWEFEQETMYVDPKVAPKEAPKKKPKAAASTEKDITKMTLKKFFTLRI